MEVHLGRTHIENFEFWFYYFSAKNLEALDCTCLHVKYFNSINVKKVKEKSQHGKTEYDWINRIIWKFRAHNIIVMKFKNQNLYKFFIYQIVNR